MKRHFFTILLLLSLANLTQGQINITGLTDQSIYPDQLTFTIEHEVGYSYDAKLDGESTPIGIAVPVTTVDYHELLVTRTNDVTQEVSSERVRFIVSNSERNGSEDGIPAHTPHPLVPSTPAEFAGAQLQLLIPKSYPQGMPIPVVVWVMTASNHAVRVNGMVTAPGQAGFRLLRGVGSGFLPGTNTPGPLDYEPTVGGLSTNRVITVESNTVWTAVAGTLAGNIDWPENSRIAITNHLTLASGGSLAVGAGSVVRVYPGVDITNNAQVVINGTADRPVVFAPVSPDQPWGGFTMRNSQGSVTGTGAIFTGSGAVSDWFGSDGNPGSHRSEQALFFCGGNNTINLTDAAAISLAGQFGHSDNGGLLTLNRVLIQRATSGGQYGGASLNFNDSALIEFPEDSAEFIDGDHDALYIGNGTHGFTNTLFGWTKDDGVDSGGSGAGLLNFQSCWFEGIFHEGNSLSGTGKIVNHRHDVFLDCGQGLESGYSGPEGLLDDCLVLQNQSGGRFGDNYSSFTYTGKLTATNSILIHNHRDVWGVNFDDWTWRTNQMFIAGNWFTAPIPLHPDNRVWNPADDAWRLAAFLTTPLGAPVGVGLAVRTARLTLEDLAEGVPVRLSSFTANTVAVDYLIQLPGSTVANGTLEFQPGETLKRIPAPAPLPTSAELVRLHLTSPVHAELTGVSEAWFLAAPPALVPAGAIWRYLDTGTNAGTAWRRTDYEDADWPAGPAQLGYGEGDEATVISDGGDANNRHITTYFRHRFIVENPAQHGGLTLRLKRDDGGVVYLNNQEIFRSSITNGAVDYLTRAITASDDGQSWFSTNTPPSLLESGTNVLAVEIHQSSPTSSDVSFDCELTSTPLPVIDTAWFGNDWVLHWQDPSFLLETANHPTGPWTPMHTAGPVTLKVNAVQQFFRLKQP